MLRTASTILSNAIQALGSAGVLVLKTVMRWRELESVDSDPNVKQLLGLLPRLKR